MHPDRLQPFLDAFDSTVEGDSPIPELRRVEAGGTFTTSWGHVTPEEAHEIMVILSARATEKAAPAIKAWEAGEERRQEWAREQAILNTATWHFKTARELLALLMQRADMVPRFKLRCDPRPLAVEGRDLANYEVDAILLLNGWDPVSLVEIGGPGDLAYSDYAICLRCHAEGPNNGEPECPYCGGDLRDFDTQAERKPAGAPTWSGPDHARKVAHRRKATHPGWGPAPEVVIPPEPEEGPPDDGPSLALLKDCIRRIYEDHCVGCCLHVVTDDGNVDDDSIAFCITYAKEQGHPFCEEVARLLLRAPMSMRREACPACEHGE